MSRFWGQGLQVKTDLNFDQVRAAVSTAAMIVIDESYASLFEHQADLVHRAAERGFFIDAGHLPDQAIRTIGKRGAELTFDRAFDHPFGARPWLLTHTWEGDARTRMEDSWIPPEERDEYQERLTAWRVEHPRTTHLYLIEPTSNEERFGAAVTEYAFATMENSPRKMKFFLLPFAKVRLDHRARDHFTSQIEGPDYARHAGAAGSALNPMMTALLLLNTRGVATETVAAPTITNEARARKGRGPIPGFTRVLSADYVTAILGRPRHKGAAQAADTGDKRRSPIPHVRRGHIRTFQSGEQTWIRDMLIGVKDEGELAFAERHRAGYRIKGAGT